MGETRTIVPLDPDWWRRGVVYQVYPRSFQDSNGDGIGDLDGVIQRLDYIAALGVDAIWLSPIYASPMADFGYDVSDHTAIDPCFGTMQSFRGLVEAIHARGLRLIMDYIPNHTSDRHRWFEDSRASRAAPRRDWYIWRDPAPGGGPPNNWRSEFGGPAWTYDAATEQYYYHAFLRSQPDLNWRNPDVAAAMLDVLRFWLDLGVDGFRVDAVHHLVEDEALTDNPWNPHWTAGMDPADQLFRRYSTDQPETHAAVASMRRLLDSYGRGGVLIGEAYLPLDKMMAYYGRALDGFHLPFNFHLITTPWTPADIARLIQAYEALLPKGGWPNWVLGNHDRSRVASRIGPENARMAAVLLLSLRGTPTLYQGDELGMTDVDIPPDRVRDPWEINVPGLGLGRDPVRTPMLWSARAHAGFSTAPPWLPLSPDWRDINVARQAADPRSMLALYRELLALRRAQPALAMGDYGDLRVGEALLSYERRHAAGDLSVALNFSGQPASLADFRGARLQGQVLLSSDYDRPRGAFWGDLVLAPREAVILAR